jgi:hypothetical protein
MSMSSQARKGEMMKRFKRSVWFRPVAALLAAIQVSSCSLFVSSMQPVAITASDPTAQIFVDGSPVGTGTVTQDLKRDRGHAFMAKTSDNRAGTATIGTKISTTGVLDIVGGFFLLVPFIGLVSPGFWSLDTDQVAIAIPPAPTNSDLSARGNI